MNSSPVGIPSSGEGMSEVVWTERKDCRAGSVVGEEDEDDMSRARMVSLRATSKPFRSSAG